MRRRTEAQSALPAHPPHRLRPALGLSQKPWNKFLCSCDTVTVACVLQIAPKVASMCPHAESQNAFRSLLARS